ncbi:hypothetical protein PDJAM_G00217820, partial [Pangasius djambal]|nr:hypothetical protein [Pangasius djambal]
KCRITDEGGAALTAALRSNSSLKVLDLRDNKLTDSVTKQLSEILKHSGGHLIHDLSTFLQSKMKLGGNKHGRVTSEPESSTVQEEQRWGEMQYTELGGSSVDSNTGSSVDSNVGSSVDDVSSQQNQDGSGTVTEF